MSEVELDIERLPQKDRRLGRYKVHDPRSKNFPVRELVDPSTWVTKSVVIYDPRPNPNQTIGDCTGCAKAMQMNARGNRVAGVVLNLADADQFYHWATVLDGFQGMWPPDDTGSSGLASAKAAQQLKVGADYTHVFNGANGVVQQIMAGKVVSVGTKWYNDMFTPVNGIIEPTGDLAGGHQYSARGYDKKNDLVIIRCWWGPDFRDVKIKREHLNELIMDGGDAHVQTRVM